MTLTHTPQFSDGLDSDDSPYGEDSASDREEGVGFGGMEVDMEEGVEGGSEGCGSEEVEEEEDAYEVGVETEIDLDELNDVVTGKGMSHFISLYSMNTTTTTTTLFPYSHTHSYTIP